MRAMRKYKGFTLKKSFWSKSLIDTYESSPKGTCASYRKASKIRGEKSTSNHSILFYVELSNSQSYILFQIYLNSISSSLTVAVQLTVKHQYFSPIYTWSQSFVSFVWQLKDLSYSTPYTYVYHKNIHIKIL